MSKHTAGPWHQGQGNGIGSIFSESGRMRLETGGTTLYPIASVVTGWKEEEDEANSRLIAAAPELLEALKNLIMFPLGAFQVEAARKAIAKATGDNDNT